MPAQPDDIREFRRCHDCGGVKPISEFAFANKAKGTRQGRCRKCHAAYPARSLPPESRHLHPAEVARIKRYRGGNRRLLREYLRAHPFVDCGESDIVTLQFDHRDRSAKRTEVARLVVRKPWSVVLDEITC